MIRSLSLDQIATPLHAQLLGATAGVSFSRVSTDSRALQPGDLFVALRGERFDAHDYLAEAAAAGAVALLVENGDKGLECPQLVVEDTTGALGELAKLNRGLYRGPLIGLTGSCGKTTTKEMLASVLSQCGPVHVTAGNLNNHIGVPQTLLAMPPGCRFAIIEMGASGPGEIDYLAGIAQPTVALVNNVMAAHLQGFGSEAGVAREKACIYRHLMPGGVAIINADEPYAPGWQAELRDLRPDVGQITFSLVDSDADVTAAGVCLQANGCYQFQLLFEQSSVLVNLPLPGRQNIANALAVAACCLAAGVSLEVIASGLQQVKPVSGRMNPRQGLRGCLLIDDSYNANPGSVLAAARLLQDLQSSGRETLLVLGDLAELGDDAVPALTQLGEDIQALDLPAVLTCGDNSRHVSEAFNRRAGRAQKARHFASREALLEYLDSHISSVTAVLVKGSRSARMETLVQALTSSGEQP